MKNLSDIEIIESVKRGNDADFTLIVDRYKDKAFNLLKRMLKNDMDAEEALQDSFLKAFRYLTQFREEASFSTWFYRIVYNTALSVIASKKRKIEKEMASLEDMPELISYDREIYAKAENPEEYLMKLIDKLPVRNALVLILYYIDGLSLNEISRVMDISLVNAKVLLHRSRNILRDLLLKHNYQEEIL
ncbi:putative RNA polymerase sigma-70 factor ECF subfamily [Melioribacter roseus P3M-2]|uniref:Putative RNA polymerase sigma-70 factor ECF subfamily n=1 Tax=Melioribacter roseus (strain DSM 23840 / JCM 17771 / VKM B-2668 / P3M-2) TaxID=1191523 RepID=I6YWQ1_MELRP|nr:RNA polymerase sigma factor [Melioribacter roseus]AFN74992.1 putative RNA polymerase sigma-70 factor ECF subfamily [Melioribacter roseus P3M-2]